ncbi:MAG: phosphoribosyltransferase [Candidatus Thermoplasmatota archaeon]|jgi:hypoxanthine phosphoribosyltransferase|nr:phosphoribosyltransferase [Candidatus Thermoplasmatota archaeon]MCL5793365.1 phosphoribosyltransferase [Candidatus Thermoplasmatota archaeon]
MEFHARLVRWKEIEDWCISIRDKVLDSYDPDVIIGLSRGGLVPARILSDMLWIKDLYAVKTEHWGITAKADGKAILREDGTINVANRKVLIVDDITDTGSSMMLARDYVFRHKPAGLKTSTMLHITHSKYRPDFFAEEVEDKNWTWFIFPWNVYEDILNLTLKVLKDPMTLSALESALKEHFDLNTEAADLEEILNYLAARGRIIHSGNLWAPARPS